MRNLVSLLFLVLFFTGCDKIPPRVPPVKPECTLDSAAIIVRTNALVSNTRKVLLEDYTGHTCGNCPPAAKKAEELLGKYNRLIVIANHVSETFAKPKVLDYFEDFRDPSSTDWDVFFNMSGAGLPKGSVNRMLILDKYPQNYSTWEGNVVSELAKPQSVKLDLTTTYDPGQKILNVKVLTTFKAVIAEDVYLNMVLTMDSVVGDQKDYLPPSGAVVVNGDRRPDYRFDHIMVKSLNGTWGQLLKSGGTAVNDTVSVRKDCNVVSKCFYKDQVCTDDRHMYLVVFAYNNKTKEILQVEKVKIR
ncbi:MAG: Omp28-related outer membrane protein [Bacteroidota bacterium]